MGDRLWTSTARTVFWNRAIAEVLRVLATTPFPPVTPSVEVGDDGVVRTADGGTLDRQVVVAPSTVVLAGEKVAERGVDDSEAHGLTAWRTRRARFASRVASRGCSNDSDFSGRARITVFACEPGTST